MMEHDVRDREAEAWLRRARRLREASRVKFDPTERQTLIALAEDCETIARRLGSRHAATTADDDRLREKPLSNPRKKHDSIPL